MRGENMSILFVSNTYKLFSNLNTGASNRSTMFIKALAQIGEVDVVAFNGEEISTISNCRVIYGKRIDAATMPTTGGSRWKKFHALFINSVYDIYPQSEEKIRIINQYMQGGDYDFVACRYINEAVECGLLRYADRLIMDIDDNPAHLYLVLQRISPKTSLRNRFYQKLYANMIGRNVRKALDKVFCAFHSSPIDSPSPKSTFLHNVAIQKENESPISETTPKSILMVGTCDYPPNAEGVKHFVKKILPMIIAEEPSAEFYLAGKTKFQDLTNELAAIEHVNILGYVEDLAQAYNKCRVVIIPIYSGSGTCIKTIEAMTMRRPCVSTLAGARGYSSLLVSDTDYILAKDDEEFADGVIKLLRDINKGNQLAQNAYNKYQKYWSQEQFIDIVKTTVLSKIHKSEIK